MGKALTYDDIKVNDEITPYVRKFMQENVNIVMAVIGSVPNWHVDPDQAQAVSAWTLKEDCTALPGVMTEMGVSEFMVNWLGDHQSWVCGGQMDIALIAPVQIHVTSGGDVTYKGKVVDKKIVDGKKCVMCEIYGEQDGIKVMRGTAKFCQ
jgi:hypothetical protein